MINYEHSCLQAGFNHDFRLIAYIKGVAQKTWRFNFVTLAYISSMKMIYIYFIFKDMKGLKG
jgi:hypothetical protein